MLFSIRYFVLAATLCLMSLTSCGGSSSSTTLPPPTTPPANQAPVFSSSATASLVENTTNAFYTVDVSDPDSSATPSLTLFNLGDGQFFELDPSTNTIFAVTTLDFEMPADENGDNVYSISLQATDGNGGSTNFTLMVDVTDVADELGFGLSPTAKPSENFDLADWKLDTPFNESGGFEGIQAGVQDYEIAGYEHPIYFYTGADGGLVMRSPVIGAKTSVNARYTRTELREMLRRGDRSISTRGSGDRPNLNNFAFSSAPISAQQSAGGVDGRLRVTLAVNAVTTTGANNQVGRLIIGQIHAKDDEPIRLYYRKLPNNTHGSIYARHEPVGQDDVNFDMIGGVSSSLPNPDNGIMLDEIFTYEIIARGNFLDVVILQEDTILAEQTIDMTNSGYDVEDDFMYFKAGVYHVNDTADPEEYAQVTIYELKNSHEGYAFSE